MLYQIQDNASCIIEAKGVIDNEEHLKKKVLLYEEIQAIGKSFGLD